MTTNRIWLHIGALIRPILPVSLLMVTVSSVVMPLEAAATAGTLVCVPNQAKTFSFKDLVELIRDEKCQIRSIDDVIASLPDAMKSNFALFYRSQSIQGPHKVDYLYPRAILTSADSEYEKIVTNPAIALSFNGHPSQRAYDKLEVVDIDPKGEPENMFRYFEISFPKDAVAKNLTWKEAQSTISVSKPNPEACTRCHGSPARPIFPTYPDWAGSFGSREMTPLTDEERSGLAEFIKLHNRTPDSRYRHINPGRLVAQSSNSPSFRPGITDTISFETTGSASPSARFQASMDAYNNLRTARTVRKLPIYTSFKYAINAAFTGCGMPSKYLPKPVFEFLRKKAVKNLKIHSTVELKKIDDIFYRRAPYKETEFGDFHGMQFPYDDLVNHRRDISKIATHKRYWNNDPVLFALWVDTLSKQGVDKTSTTVVPLRFLFEGLGFDIRSWFIELNLDSYRGIHIGPAVAKNLEIEDSDLGTIASRFPIANGESYKEREQRLCHALAQESLKALQGFDLGPYQKAKVDEAAPTELPSASQFPSVFTTICSGCHTESPVGPRIPFNDQDKFNHWIRNETNLRKVRYRLFEAHEGERMPPTRDLNDRESKELNRYFESIK